MEEDLREKHLSCELTGTSDFCLFVCFVFSCWQNGKSTHFSSLAKFYLCTTSSSITVDQIKWDSKESLKPHKSETLAKSSTYLNQLCGGIFIIINHYMYICIDMNRYMYVYICSHMFYTKIMQLVVQICVLWVQLK